MDWKQQAERMKFDEGKTWTQITDALGHCFTGLTWAQARERIRGYIRSCDRYQPQKPKVKETKPEKLEVIQNFEPPVTEVDWKGNRIVRFGIVSDTHLNSKYAQITHLNAFYDECLKQGIKHIYHSGDIDEGEQMRPGHQYECYTQGADDHIEEIVRIYPRRTGITTHFITGNHDASTMKRCGFNMGHSIAGKRKDLEYLGQDCAIVKLTPNCTMELRHPWDGTAYAISYKIQKMIDAMSGGEKPNLLVVGHYHKAEYLPYRNIHTFQAGCFQGQTPFTRGKGLAIQMGGWIIEVSVNVDGGVERVQQQFIPYYVGIPDDHKNWR